MKIKILFSVLTIVLLAGFVFSAVASLQDISNALGLTSGEAYGQDVQTESLGSQGSRIDLTGNSPSVQLGKNTFENIVPQQQANHPSYLQLSPKGELAQADFTSNEKGGTYTFGGTTVSNPPSSRVLFSSENGIDMRIPDGSSLSNLPSTSSDPNLKSYLTTIEGNRLTLPGNFLMNGRLNSLNNQLFFLTNDQSSINNVLNTNQLGKLSTDLKQTNIFLDGSEHGATSLSFGKNNLVLESSSARGSVVGFNKENPYIPVKQDGDVAMQPLANSKIKITNSEGKIPSVEVQGDANIVNGNKQIEVDKGKVYLVNRLKSDVVPTASPIEIGFKDADGKSNLQDKKAVIDSLNQVSVVDKTQSFDQVASKNGFETNSASRIKANSAVNGLTKLFAKAYKFFNTDNSWLNEHQAILATAGVKG